MEHSCLCAILHCAASDTIPRHGAHISVADCPAVCGWQAGLIQALAKLVKQGGLGSQVREAVSEALKHLTASSQKNRDTLVAAQVLPLIIAHLQTGDHNQLMRCKHAALLPCRIWPGLSTKATAVLPRCWSISAYLHAVLLVHCACYQRCGLCIGSSPHVKLKGAVLPWCIFFCYHSLCSAHLPYVQPYVGIGHVLSA